MVGWPQSSCQNSDLYWKYQGMGGLLTVCLLYVIEYNNIFYF